MKSVVVQAATVAKAIETAWLKAGKPEEFFIRVLQEHTFGFLGFGGQKAKIAFFFKNSNKSESLFPVVLKQKEYTNFFSNKNLKTPGLLDVIDHELNKHAAPLLGHVHKKKNHQSQHKNVTQSKEVVTDKKNKPVEKPVHHVKHVAVHSTPKPVVQAEKQQQSKVHEKSHASHAPKVQTSLQVPVEKKAISLESTFKPQEQNLQKPVIKPFVERFSVDKKASSDMMVDANAKEDLVESIAQALKKVQTQKIVANVSRNKPVFNEPVDKIAVDKKTKTVQQKFENYSDFMDAQADKVAAKIAATSVPVVEKIVEQVQQVEQQSVPVQIAPEKTVQPTARPKIVIKRRILTTENPGVSGITRSSDKKDEPKKE